MGAFVIFCYRIEAAAIGYHVRLRTGWEADPARGLPRSPSTLSAPVGWALIEAGAHRKARRIIRRHRAEQTATVKEYPA